MSGPSYAEAGFVAAVNQQNMALRAECRRLVEKADGLVQWDVNAAWAEIERAANSLVEKSGKPLTKEQAVARVLKTAKGAHLYSTYTNAQEQVRQIREHVEGAAAQRATSEWVREKTTHALQKTADAFGDRAAEDHAHELAGDAAVARAFGSSAPTKVADDDASAYDPIDRAARAVLRRAPELSYEKAVDEALRENPGLYETYTAALNSGHGVSGPSPFGSADGEPLLKAVGASARQVLVELAERLERAESDGQDVDSVLAEELRDPAVRKVVMAAVDALPESTEKAASKRELRRRLEGLEASGRKARRQPREDPTTGAALAKSEAELWDEIVAKSGASPRDPNFSRLVDGFLDTPDGRKLYAQYERAYEARAA